MGLNDKDIVALSGAHTLGRSRPDRSGWGKPETKYTDIKEGRNEDLLVLPTDAGLFEDPSCKVFAVDQEAFFKDYAEAHAKLSNLGATCDPPEREISEAMKSKIRAEYEAFGGSPDKPLPSNYFLNIIILIAVLAVLTSLLGN